MAMVTDPVCGMRIDSDDAVATAEHEGKPYYFCSRACHDAFIADAARRLSRVGMDPDRLTEDELAERAGTSGEWIRQLVDLGILQRGDPLPTEKALAERYGVAVSTAHRAVSELVTFGLATASRGKRAVVT